MIFGFVLAGVTDPTKCLIRAEAVNPMLGLYSTVIAVLNVVFAGCSNGLIAQPGSYVLTQNCVAIASDPTLTVDTVITADGDGYSTLVVVDLCVLAAPSSVLPLLGGANPIRVGVYAKNGAKVNIISGSFDVVQADTTASHVFCETGAEVSITATSFKNGLVALHVGALGTNSIINMHGGLLEGNTTNFMIDSSTGAIYPVCAVDSINDNIVSGATLSGLLQCTDLNETVTIGNLFTRFPSTRLSNDLTFLYNQVSTGTTVTPTFSKSGLNITVTNGAGWIRRDAPYNDTRYVTWDGYDINLCS